MVGIDEAEACIEAVRGKFERQLARLRERERLVAVSRQDCQKEEDALERDRARHRVAKEEVRAALGGLMRGRLDCISIPRLLSLWPCTPLAYIPQPRCIEQIRSVYFTSSLVSRRVEPGPADHASFGKGSKKLSPLFCCWGMPCGRLFAPLTRFDVLPQATREQQVLLEAVAGVGEEVAVATLLQVRVFMLWRRTW